jgi:glutathione S-transferase
MPLLLRALLPLIFRRKVRKAVHAQGIGRHSYDEVADIADKSFNALASILADKDYFFGDKPSSFDAIAYAFLCQFITVQSSNKLNDKAKSYKNLVGFCQRIEKQFYS